jgi:divalent metal cation (Fe/Co/Zn/Cd) transporter
LARLLALAGRYPVVVATHPVELRPSVRSSERHRLERRARRLALGANAWHVVEFGIAVGAGIAAGSVALIAFGIDSLIEVLAGGVIVWLFSGDRGESAAAERTAQRIIAVSFYALALYVVVESVRSFTGGHPGASWVGIGLAAVTAPTMPLLARAKQRVGRQLGSRATESEGAQNMICAYLSVALLIGLGANALLGWWWADPLAGLVIAGVAVREGREAWRGEDACGCC